MNKPEWFNEFFGGLYSQILARQVDPARTLAQARLVKKLLHLRKGHSVLDIPCGQGRLTLPLAQMGLRMTGVDLTPSYIRAARRQARGQELDIRYLQGDMRKIDFDGEFDAALNWFGSFGYFSDRENLAFCRKVLRGLRPGGRLLIEGINKSWLVENFRPGADETVAGVRIIHKHRWDAAASRIRDTWTMSAGKRSETRRLAIRVFTGPELRGLLREAGFAEVRLYGYPPLGPLSRLRRRVIAVATK